jgi:hypothetical protein
VLADGVHAAFAAGAVAELARAGTAWQRGAGGGLGAHVALLAILGEAAEAERRWSREAENGCPLFRSRLAVARERLGSTAGLMVAPDSWTLSGWLDPLGLDEHLAPEMADVPGRLARLGRAFAVAVADVTAGTTSWVALTGEPADRAGALLRAAATFPAGWAPEALPVGAVGRRLWGGAGAALAAGPPWSGEPAALDVVCGFPVPAVPRPALGESLFELVQRREEAFAGAAVSRWVAGVGAMSVRVLAPSDVAYREWAGRDNAELGIEYPLPWERNGALASALIRFGASAARREASGSGGARRA